MKKTQIDEWRFLISNAKLTIFLWLILILQSNSEAQIFSKLTTSLSKGTYASGWIDYNNDNFLDAYQPTLYWFLYSNNGNGTFNLLDSCDLTPSRTKPSYTSGFCWGDYDNDGLPDLYLANLYNGDNTLFKNTGNGHFQKITNTDATKDAKSSMDCNWIDYDNDGYLDLFVTASGINFAVEPGKLNLLYKNDGAGGFTKITDNAIAKEATLSDCAAFADYDNDGDQDLFMTQWYNNNWLFENNGDGTFTKITGEVINSNTSVSITASWGDYDNDGYMDLFVGNGSTNPTLRQKSHLFHNNGDKTFTKITQGPVVNDLLGVWTSAWGDVDNDGDLDLYAGTINDKETMLYINNGDGTFTNPHEFEIDTSSNGTSVSGACFGDYDNDGFIDLQVSDASGDAVSFIFHNNGNSNHWINIKCEGTISNRSAIGTRVKVKAAIFGQTFWQIREIHSKQGFRGSNDLRASFGLGDAATIDSLVILWPSGTQTIKTNVSVNQFLSVTEEIPLNYLKPDFLADTIKGKGSLTVQFTDKSIANVSTPITSWSWDFENDGKEDSKEQNPVFTFKNDSGAVYSVSLTISNGTMSKTFLKNNLIKLYPKVTKNLALLTKATASSSESDNYSPLNAVDDDIITRWSSQFHDPQWIMIELDAPYDIDKVVLKWENSYGRNYDIQTAVDTTSWQTVYSEAKGNGSTDIIIFSPVKAKYIRMYATKRATSYGYSLYEFEVYQTAITGVNESEKIPSGFKLNQNFPNPFNPETTISYQLPVTSNVELKVFDILGKEIATLVNKEQIAGSYEVKLNGYDLSSGIYFYRLKSEKFTSTKKFILLR